MTDKRIDLMQNWLVEETRIHPEAPRKFESILCLGNGYMGVRAATDESYEKTVRYTLVAGTFDKMERKNTTELPNAADTTAVYLTADGIPLTLTQENHRDYKRCLNLHSGLLTRTFQWQPKAGVRIRFLSERFASLADRHLLGQRISVKVLEGETDLCLACGIQGGERYGEPHFRNKEGRTEGNLLQYAETTHESGITFVTSAYVRAECDGKAVPLTHQLSADRLLAGCRLRLNRGQELVMEKLSRIATTRDLDFRADGENGDREALLRRELETMTALKRVSFRECFHDSAACWQRIWQERDISITGDADADQLAYRFAVYHLTAMAPLHDSRMNIGAKGLSGKGYFGHTFWDTEVYMLPYFVWMDPAGARSLVTYRYLCLDAARRKAKENGFEGAMYPWEAAWITDGDVCPDAHFAKYEYHVTADVAYGIYYYYEVTHDMAFMHRCGCEILFETAQFWRSRLEYNAEKDQFEIRNVIGPDEFTHEANNNAYTNYLAHLNLSLAIQWKERLEQEFPKEYTRLNRLLDLDRKIAGWQEGVQKLKLPAATADHVLPQDDDFMTLPEIDLTPYRAGEKKLRQDYPYPTYTRLKVSKQADVMNLFLLREEMFPETVKKASLRYYEPFCVHESSLSLCAYSMLAADCGEQKQAYDLFARARAIDLGPNMRSSDEGIHAASLGGVWQCCVLGFCGVRLCADQLRIIPNLPESWTGVTVRIWWRGSQLELTATHKAATVRVLQGNPELSVLTSKGLLRGLGSISWEL